MHRVAQHFESLTDDIIKEVTRSAYIINHDDQNILTTIRVNLMRSLPGVGLGVASALLTLYYPNLYGIIDFRTWDEIHEHDHGGRPITRTFTLSNYLYYLDTIRPFALEQNIDVQIVDFALWKIWEQH